MIEINETLIYQFINFLALIIFLNHFLFKPVMEVVERRNNKLRSFANDSAKFAQKSEEAIKAYEEKLSQMKKSSAAILLAARQQSAVEHEKIIKESRQKYTRQIEKAREEIEKESAQTSAALKKEAETISREIASRLLGRQSG
ncbi:MAG: ATP synthase F0 subunit B [Nitrospinota bacterium]